MVLAVIGASFIGDWAEAATVVFLFGIAEWLESWAEQRAHRAIEALLDLAPKVASVRRNGQFQELPVGEVRIGETIAVKSGMKIPLDGEALSSGAFVNQAPITGESMPVEKNIGDQVFAGTINGSTSLEVRVTKAASDTTLARIIHLVREAQEQKAPTQRFVDAFARYYTPSVTAGALLIFLIPPLLLGGDWSQWLYRACVLLIIACPCALVISTPVSIVAGLTALARRGVLVKGGVHLETIARLKAIAVDKTGTLTDGNPKVQSIETLGSSPERELLRIAAAIDIHSAHPLAKAIVEEAVSRGIEVPRAEQFREVKGNGAEGRLEGHAYFVGNHRYTHSLGVCSEAIERRLRLIEEKGCSVVVVGHRPHDKCQGEVLGIIAVGDAVRTNSAAAIRALHRSGVRSVVILSGDNQGTVDAIAKSVGIDEAHGNLLPEDKAEAVRKLRETEGVVAMVGDGVNDAPAMATASIGIAMGGTGTDVAIETADITLMTDDLEKVATAVDLGKRTLGIIRFNLTFALGLKAVFLLLTLCGYASLWMAIMADTGTTLLVVANALRLLHGNNDARE
jgi:Cd2+/Zn2+-exporting ATPase